jgi:hypothetical protein
MKEVTRSINDTVPKARSKPFFLWYSIAAKIYTGKRTKTYLGREEKLPENVGIR